MRRPAPLSTTAIGSLPHTQTELALQLVLRLDVPAAPQLPAIDRAELMIPQALEGLPGASFDESGVAVIDRKAWSEGRHALEDRLIAALAGDAEPFAPSGTSYRAFRPFLGEVEERKLPFAKAQLAGPLTVRWASRLDDGAPVGALPELEAQIFKLILARSTAMARALRERGTQPIFFLDEPGLYAYDRRKPLHVVQLQELRVLVMALQKEGALVGLHSCSNTDWAAIFDLGVDLVSVDAGLSLGAVVATGAALDRFVARGGQLVLGVLPTNAAVDYDVAERVAHAAALLGDRLRPVLRSSLVAPACGLAMRTVHEADRIHADLLEAQRLLRSLV